MHCHQQQRPLAAGGRCSRPVGPARPLARRSLPVLAAKKGGEKKSAQKKGGSKLDMLLQKKAEAEQAAQAQEESGAGSGPAVLARRDQYNDPESRMLAFFVCQSYWKHTKKYLLENVDFERLPDIMFAAPFACLVHDRFQEGVTDPRFTYANKAALELWEGTWDELIGMPSRLSAPPEDALQKDRQKFVDAVAKSGFSSGYSGWRISLKGTRFRIKNTSLFNIEGIGGELIGQAAIITEYEKEDGELVRIKGDEALLASMPPPELPPSEDDMAAAEAAVAEQAFAVRQLKEQNGLANTDPRVQAAVSELKKRKDALAALQDKLQTFLKTAASLDEDTD